MPPHNFDGNIEHTNDEPTKRPTRQQKPSEKRKAQEDTKIASLERKLGHLRKRLKKGKRTETSTRETPDDDGPESEDSVAEDVMTNFTVGIRPTGTTTTPLALQRHIRKAQKGSSTIPPKPSRRAFLAEAPAPHQPANEYQEHGEVAEPLFDESGHDSTLPNPERSEPPVPPQPTQSAAAAPPSGPLPPTLKQPRFREGYTRGNRIKAADYEPPIEAMLLRAAQEYEVRISTLGAFPDTQQQAQWVVDCWAAACAVSGELYDLTSHMKHLIKSRASRIRGSIITKLRPSVVRHYGFTFRNTPTAIAQNRATYTKLKKELAYFCKNTETCDGYARHPIFLDLLHQAWFDHKKALGITYSTYFNPISLHTMALMFTCVEFCVEEWSSGTHCKNRFTEEDAIASYRTNFNDVNTWDQLEPTATRRIREVYYTKSRCSAGVALLTAPQSNITPEMATRIRAQLQGSTGTTDDEGSDVHEGV